MTAKRISQGAVVLTAVGAVVITANAMSKKKFLSDKNEKIVLAATGVSAMVFLLAGMSSVVPEL